MLTSVNSDSSLAVATWVATYALIDCCVANLVSESEAKLSSSSIAEPDTPVLITGLVRVLFDKACDVDISTVVAVSILRVAEPEVAPPDKPVPATTAVISPVGTVATCAST